RARAVWRPRSGAVSQRTTAQTPAAASITATTSPAATAADTATSPTAAIDGPPISVGDSGTLLQRIALPGGGQAKPGVGAGTRHAPRCSAAPPTRMMSARRGYGKARKGRQDDAAK